MWNIDGLFSTLNIDPERLRSVFIYDPQAPMIFSSGIFLWLFAAFMLVYLVLQHRATARLLFVTLFSYYFYYKSSGTYFFLVGACHRLRFLYCPADSPRTGSFAAQGVGGGQPEHQSGLAVLF